MRKISYAKIPNTVAYNSTIDLEARMLYVILSCLQGPNDFCYPSIRWMSEKCNCKRTKISRLLKILTENNLIERIKDPVARKTVTRVYKI